MENIILEAVKLLLMVAFLVFFRYIIPWAKETLGAVRYAQLEREIIKLVYAVQERYGDSKSGEERRAIVRDKIKDFLTNKKIYISDEELRELNDAAVKTMKIAQEYGLKVNGKHLLE